MNMKSGEYIYARSHADFLNKAFGTNYKAWMKCVWKYSDNLYVWMVRFNHDDGGWRNSFVSSNRIKEENLLEVKTWDGLSVKESMHKRRIVIEIENVGRLRKYTFRGIYVYDEENSDPYTVRYHDKIADEF